MWAIGYHLLPWAALKPKAFTFFSFCEAYFKKSGPTVQRSKMVIDPGVVRITFARRVPVTF